MYKKLTSHDDMKGVFIVWSFSDHVENMKSAIWENVFVCIYIESNALTEDG
jgi:hypothetical protein